MVRRGAQVVGFDLNFRMVHTGRARVGQGDFRVHDLAVQSKPLVLKLEMDHQVAVSCYGGVARRPRNGRLGYGARRWFTGSGGQRPQGEL